AAPRHLSGFASAPMSGTPQEIAHRFAADHRALLGVGDDAALTVTRTQSFDGSDYVRLGLTAGGLPVDGAELVVRVRDRRVTLVNNGLPDPWQATALDDVI